MRAVSLSWPTVAVLIGSQSGSKAALGEPLTFYFSGEVRFIHQSLQLDQSVYVGAPFSGGYTFDPSGATDTSPSNPNVGNYPFPSGQLWAQMGNYEFVTPDLIMFIQNDSLSGDIYEPISVTDFFAAGIQWTIMNVLLGDESRTALNSDALPLYVPDLADFPDARSLSLYLPGNVLGMRGQLTSLTPEPASVALLAFGAAVVAWRRRR